MSTQTPPSRARTRRTDTPAGKVLAAGLAGATCLGLVGVIGIRSATDAAANGDQAAADLTAADAAGAADAQLNASTTTDGVTQAQLDAYAQQLAQERQRLIDYRAYLVDVASQLQSAADASGVRIDQASFPAATGKKKAPGAQQQAVPQPRQQKQSKPHAQTQGS